MFFLISAFFVTRSWINDPHLGRFSAPEAHGLFSRDTWQYILANASLHGLRFVIPDTEWHINGVLGGQAINAPLWTLFWEGRMYVMVALLAWLRPCRCANGYVWETQLWSMFLVGCYAARWPRGCAWGRCKSLAPSCLSPSTGPAPQRWAYLRRHDYSYGIYLYHWPIMTMLKAAIPSMTALPMIAAGIGLTIPMAMLSWHLVEAPAMRAMRRQLSGRRLHVVETALTDDPAWQRSGPAPSSRQHQN